MDFLFLGSSDYKRYILNLSRGGLKVLPALHSNIIKRMVGQALSSLKRAWTWKEAPANHIFISKKSFLYSLWSEILQYVSCFNETGRYLYILANPFEEEQPRLGCPNHVPASSPPGVGDKVIQGAKKCHHKRKSSFSSLFFTVLFFFGGGGKGGYNIPASWDKSQ